MSKRMYLIEVTDDTGKVIYSTDVEVEEGKQGGLVRLLSSTLDEAFGGEDD